VLSTDEEDIAAIDELHRRDVMATKASDFEALKSLMDAECIVFPPDSGPEPGQTYLDRVIASAQSAKRQDEIIELVQDWEELKLFGAFAYECGIVQYAVRGLEGEIIRESQRLMRFLRRQQDNSWRVYRAMWHEPRADS